MHYAERARLRLSGTSNVHPLSCALFRRSTALSRSAYVGVEGPYGRMEGSKRQGQDGVEEESSQTLPGMSSSESSEDKDWAFTGCLNT